MRWYKRSDEEWEKDHYFLARLCKGKGKSHPRKGHEDPKGKDRYSCALPLTPADFGKALSYWFFVTCRHRSIKWFKDRKT
jgi:hypothetical protein